MVDYTATFDKANNRFIIQSEAIAAGSILVQLPDTDTRKKQYISLFLHKADIEEGLDFLHYISADKHPQINQALFMGALNNMMKCFQSSAACNQLNEKRFIKAFPNESRELKRFKNWRNKHFVHDENAMRLPISFLIVSPQDQDNPLGGPPSVFWNKAPIDYLLEGRELEVLMQAIWRFIRSEIDKIGQSILDEYQAKTREELLSYGRAETELATTANPDRPRT